MIASKILIADDELSIRIMLSRMIEPLHHEIYCAEDGVMASDIVRQVGIDLIISDLMMPRMDGLTLLKHVRDEGFDCAFIILTGFGDLPQALAARANYNISNFLVKPIHNMDQFLFDVESALTRRVLERENRQLLGQLRDVNADLEAKVRARTRELESKNTELARVSRFRADALRVLGHELRTPLSILSGFHTLAASGSGESFATLSQHMGDSIERLQQIVERALALLKARETTRFALELGPTRPSELCARVVDRIRPFIARRNLQILVPPPCGNPEPCIWDGEKMELVVEELLINAVKASVDGSRIEIGLDADGPTIELSIRDFGVGVPTGQHERIFEPFVTLRNALNHGGSPFEFGGEGVGIGLSIARLWVGLHGGSLTAQPNEEIPGTTLTVTIPRDATARLRTLAAEASDPGDGEAGKDGGAAPA
jgi:signal transduction histidine kinase